jgi:hypothetical protein
MILKSLNNMLKNIHQRSVQHLMLIKSFLKYEFSLINYVYDMELFNNDEIDVFLSFV